MGSGNIGTDLLYKILRLSDRLEVAAMVGIDPDSDGLARAAKWNIATTHEGIDGLVKMPEFEQLKIVFDATSAAAHHKHHEVLTKHGKQIIDLTPAAIGPYTVPSVNLDQHLEAENVNMVTCGGQATIPIVAAVNRVAPVTYAEIVSTIASKSAGPGTRANIDEFTETTSKAIESVGGAKRGKAIIILNPAEPPIMMRNTIYCFVAADVDQVKVAESIEQTVADVKQYVPGYALKQDVQFESIDSNSLVAPPGLPRQTWGTKISVFLQVAGAAHYLPAYAGNLDIMTSAAMRTAERLVELRIEELAS